MLILNKKLNLDKFLNSLEDLKEGQDCVISVLSGGLDSSILTYLLCERYGREKVRCLSFFYEQKQAFELEMAKKTTTYLGVQHKLLDISALAQLSREVSANISGTSLKMPRIQDVLGEPQPVTYVPFRNMILASFAFSYAEAQKASFVYMGLQAHDIYNYWDTSPSFVASLNELARQNRKYNLCLKTPFAEFSKTDELELALQLEQKKAADSMAYQKNPWNFVRLGDSLTCYEPQVEQDKTKVLACGYCPSCSERIMAFSKLGYRDPVSYKRKIDWDKLIT